MSSGILPIVDRYQLTGSLLRRRCVSSGLEAVDTMEAARMCKDFLTKKQKTASFSATLQIQARKSKHLNLIIIPLSPKNGPLWSKSRTEEIHHYLTESVFI